MQGKDEERIDFRWGVPELDDGFVQIPHYMIRNYHRAGVSNTEFALIVHLASYKYDLPDSECRPSLAQITKYMGYRRTLSVRRLVASLKKKRLLKVRPIPGKPSVYDFSAFSRRMQRHFKEERKEQASQGGVENDTPLSFDTPLKNDTPIRNDRTPPSKMIGVPPSKMIPEEEEYKKSNKKKGGEKRHPDHQRLMALYREAIREDEGVKKGKELSAPGKENKAAQKILQGGLTPEEAMECYRHFKGEPFWRDKHLSLAYVAEHIGAWKEAKGEKPRRAHGKPGISQAQRDYYASHLDPKD